MDQLPDGTPWWAVAFLVVLIFFILPVYRIHSGQKKQGRETREQIAKVDHQVSNNHGSNLRDDVDKAIELSRQNAESSSRVERAVMALTESQNEAARDVRTLTHRLDEAIRERHEDVREVRVGLTTVNGRLTEHIEESLRASRDQGATT